MEPTLQIGDRIVVDKLSYHLHGVDRGNIIVFSTPAKRTAPGLPSPTSSSGSSAFPARPSRCPADRSTSTGTCSPSRGCRPTNSTRPTRARRRRRTRCTTPTESRRATSTSWVTTGRSPATAATGVPSPSRPSSARSTCGSGRSRGSASSRAVGQRPALASPHDAQARPGLVDGAHLVVHQPERQRDLRARRPRCMVVSTPEDRLGQATQSPPAGKIIRASASMRRSKSRRSVKKATTTSAVPRAWRFTVDPGRQPAIRPGGAPISATRRALGDPQLLGQRRPAVAGHRH